MNIDTYCLPSFIQAHIFPSKWLHILTLSSQNSTENILYFEVCNYLTTSCPIPSVLTVSRVVDMSHTFYSASGGLKFHSLYILIADRIIKFDTISKIQNHTK